MRIVILLLKNACVQTSKIWTWRLVIPGANWKKGWTNYESLSTKKNFMVSVLIHSAKKRWQLSRMCYESLPAWLIFPILMMMMMMMTC